MADLHCSIIDTNVWAIAEGMHGGASDRCVAACLSLLNEVERGSPLAVDTKDEILAEYVSTLDKAGTSGLAVKLAKKLWRTRGDPATCVQVPITPIQDPEGSYAEVPEHVRDFDSDDQKFLAVAAAEGGNPPLFVGLDGEWWERRGDLTAAGFDIQFVCPTDLFGTS